MRKKIVKPSGAEIGAYLDAGDAICNKCGALMDREPDPQGGCDVLTCPSCGWRIDDMDYAYDGFKDAECASLTLAAYDGDVPPAGCLACGGPYPDCKTSCKLFDD